MVQFSSSHLILIEKGAALNEVYELEVKSLDNTFTTNLFPTTILIQNQDSSTRKSAVFALTMTQFTFAMSFNSASLNDLIVSCENVPSSAQNLKATRCSVIFPSLHFFHLHQRVRPSLLRSISHGCIDILPRNCTHRIAG